ncbi:sigma-70 family RNA polymerase sigma factor [Paraflavisolibacter sp. H34]|uniref:RNA polymerase sigma factor n=1 Tax=Huijunlia imazamoxiresistens TaxID=3127457 RepID=UPI00301728D8
MDSQVKEGSPEENSIIDGLQAGGSRRLLSEKGLYERYFYLIRQGTLKYSISEEEAASAYSDAVISVIDNILTGRFESRSSLKSYIYQIFLNKCVDAVRRKTTQKNVVHKTTGISEFLFALPDKARNVIQQLTEKHQRSTLLEKLAELGEKCRQLLLLFEDGYSDREIAEVMAYNSADVVKTSRLRCLEKLKEKVFHRNP